MKKGRYTYIYGFLYFSMFLSNCPSFYLPIHYLLIYTYTHTYAYIMYIESIYDAAYVGTCIVAQMACRSQVSPSPGRQAGLCAARAVPAGHGDLRPGPAE